MTEKEAKRLINLSLPKKNNFTRKHNKYKKEEAKLVKTVMQYLTLKGYVAIRNNSGAIFLNNNGTTRAIRLAQSGSPDIIACSPDGKFIAIECKSKNGKLTKQQQNFLEKIKKCGGVALVIKNIDEIINIF